MESIKINTAQNIDIDYPVARIGERAAAWLVDTGIFILALILFLFVLATLPKGFSVISISLMVFIYTFYDLACEIFMNGQSIGKKILKIRVISLNGAQASLGQYFIRWIFRLVDCLLTGWVGGLVCIAVSENKQRIGDMVAGTILIKTEARTKLNEVAFIPPTQNYEPVFNNVGLLSDSDLALIHEVVATYYKTRNPNLVYQMALKVKDLLQSDIPQGMNELSYLETVVKDYNFTTSKMD